MEPHIACRAIITDEEGRILLVRRAEGVSTGEWCLPGGKPNSSPKETEEQTVIREVEEETSLIFTGTYADKVESPENEKGEIWLTYLYVGKAVGRIVLQHENSDAGFFTDEERAELPIAFGHHEIIENILNKLT